jgi:divalent metal cation (Fe/Co/Zn/Cd) transporter
VNGHSYLPDENHTALLTYLMELIRPVVLSEKEALYRWANVLALITIFYNIAEGLVSVYFGFADRTISLFGFGLDSFVEVISGVGIWHMIGRLRKNNAEQPDRFERRALRITGSSFYLLTAGLIVTAISNLISRSAPETTLWGIIVSLISIFSMWALVRAKTKVGRRLNSRAILADAGCTKTCLYLSFILLAASAGYELTGIGGMDSAGALLIAWSSFREGREAFEKAKGEMVCCCGGDCH